MKTFGKLVCFAAIAAALLTQSAKATVLYWFTGETYATGTTFNFGTSVTADVGSAIAQVSDGTDILPPGTPQAGQTSNNAQSYAITITPAPGPVPGRPGTKAIRFEVRALDFKYVGHRSELSLASVPSGGVYWYSWSVYVPAGNDENYDEILGQFHAADNVIGSPVFSASRSTYGNTRAWAVGQTTGNPATAVPFDRVAYQADRWVDWVVQVKYARDGTGFLNVWKDGKQVISKTNIYTDYPGSSYWPYFKFGNYKWPWKVAGYAGTYPTRVQYYDEIKVGDASETYESMAPRGKPAPTDLAAIGGRNSVELSWTVSAPATSYNVKRSITSGGPYTTIGSTNLSSYTDSTVKNHKDYYYVVSAVTSVGESADSDQVNVTPYAATVAAPTFTPEAGVFSSPQAVAIDGTGHTTIRYTIDGSLPSPASGNVYSAPIPIATTQTLRAVAYKPNHNPSPITSGLYTRQSSVALALPMLDGPMKHSPFQEMFSPLLAKRVSPTPRPRRSSVCPMERKPPSVASPSSYPLVRMESSRCVTEASTRATTPIPMWRARAIRFGSWSTSPTTFILCT
jgi:hypothetical protein